MPTRRLLYFKPHTKRLGALLLSLLLICALLPATLSTKPTQAQAATQATTVSTLLGISRQDFVSYLTNHKNDYLGTAYKSDWPNPTTYQTGPWWSRGNHPYEATEFNGVSGYGMNCSGFLARVWCDMGGENTAFMQQWKRAHDWMWANSETLRQTLIALGATHYTFDSKEALLASGKLQKGDLVQMASDSGTDDHVGIFWGENPSDDRFWHSIYDHGSTTTGRNVISEMYGKMTSGTYYLFKFDERGWFKLWKESSNSTLTADNKAYSLAGATFGVYASEADARANQNRISTLETKAHADYDVRLWGYAESTWLSPGSYYVKELTPAKGYALPNTNVIQRVTVTAGEEASVSLTFADPPKAAPISVALFKTDSQTNTSTAQGNASLANAHFTLRYYDATYASAKEALASGAPKKTWIIKTNHEGKATLDENSLVSGDKLYRDRDGNVVLPLGSVVIEETKAPQGYKLPANAQPILRTIGDTTSFNDTVLVYNPPTVADDVICGGIRITKLDAESHEKTALGGASLDGTTFEIALASNTPVYVDGIKYRRGDVVKTLVITDGVAQTKPDCLPYATYTITETAPGEGYQLTDGTPRTFSITEPGVIVEPFATQNTFDNQVKRGDLELIKVGEGTMERLAHVPFRLTSKTTGESHIVVTDENGKLSTHASWNPHTYSTNANDAAEVDSYDPDAGVWFGATQSGNTTPPNDKLGALPYDTYQLTELACSANAGYQLVDIDNIVIKKDKQAIDLGTVVDSVTRTPEIATFASDGADNDKFISPTTDAVILDEVAYENLEVGKSYLLKASLHVVETDEAGNTATHPVTDANDAPVTTSHVFMAHSTHAATQVSLSFDATAYADQTLVLFEELFEGNSSDPIATHVDPADSGQQVHIKAPRIQTKAADLADQDNVISAEQDISIEDVVTYSGLVPNKTYELHAVLMVKETAEPLVDSEGNSITVAQAFTPDSPDGEAKVSFQLDACKLAGQTLVVFESLTHNGQEIALHADLEDNNQTIEVREPSIVSFASDLTDGAKALQLGSAATLVDMVHYNNLTPRSPSDEDAATQPPYIAVGLLIDKATEKPLSLNPSEQNNVDSFYERFQESIADNAQNGFGALESLLDEYAPYADTLPVQVEALDPEASEGSLEMQFELPDTLEDDTDVIIYQYLYRTDEEGEGNLIGVDADIENENQTVTFVAPPSEEPPTPPTPPAPETPEQDFPKTPLAKTGDETMLGVLALIGISALALVVLSISRKRGQKSLGIALVCTLVLSGGILGSFIGTTPERAYAGDVKIELHQGSVTDAKAQGIVLDSRRVFDISKATFSTTNPAQLTLTTQRIDRDPVHQTYRGIALQGTPAKGARTNVPGTASLLWTDIGCDTQGDRVDVEITLSDITIFNKTSNDDVILLLTEVEGYGILEAQAITNTGLCGNSKTLSLNVYKTGTTTPAEGRFLMGVRDLDLPDRVSSNTPNYQGEFAESVQLLQGFESDIYINEACFLSIDPTRALFQPTQEDFESSFDSGFVVSLNPTGSRFTWAGTTCGTVVFDQFESHNITARAEQGGSITNQGTTRVGWKNDKTYYITPDEHYEIADVVVDGQPLGAFDQFTFTNIVEDHEIIARFKPILITVIFTDGLNTLLSTERIIEGSTPVPPELPTREGYLFESWDTPIEQLFADTTINALWKPITYYVAFDNNGGEGEMPNQAFTFDESATLDPCAFTKPEHTFDGWIDEEGQTFEDEALVRNLAASDLAEVNLTAQWEEASTTPEPEEPDTPEAPKPILPDPELPDPPEVETPDTSEPEVPTPPEPDVPPEPDSPTVPTAPEQVLPEAATKMPEQTPEDTQLVETAEVVTAPITNDETPAATEDPQETQESLPQTADEVPFRALLLLTGAAACIALFGAARLTHHRRHQGRI